MSKKQDQIAQQMLDAYKAAMAAAQRKSPEEEELSRQAMETLGWARGGDYRSPPKNIFYNFADPAERKRQMELIAGAGARGTAALGTPNSTALMLDKHHRDAVFDEDQAANYQENVSRAIGNATGLAGGLAQQDQARRDNVLGVSSSMGGQALQYQLRDKPKWWQTFLNSFGQGLGSAVGGAATGGLGSVASFGGNAGGLYSKPGISQPMR